MSKDIENAITIVQNEVDFLSDNAKEAWYKIVDELKNKMSIPVCKNFANGCRTTAKCTPEGFTCFEQ